MASPITWRNVGRGNNGAAVGLLNSATSDFNNAFKGINAAVGDIEQGRENEYKHLVKTNTDEFLNRINSFNNVDDFAAAQQSGEFQNMLAGYNGDVNQELTRGAVAAQLRKLQNRRTDEIAYTTANANEDERLAVAAEKPFITELNNLFEVDPDKARALAQQYGETGKIRDYSGLMETWETEERSDRQDAQDQAAYDRTQTRNAFEDGQTAQLEALMAENNKIATAYNDNIDAYIRDNNVPTIGDVPGGAVDFSRMGKIAMKEYLAYENSQTRAQSEDELIKEFNKRLMGTAGSRLSDYGAGDALIQAKLDGSLNDTETDGVKTQVDSFIRNNGYMTLENNIMSYQNQSQFGGVNGLQDAEAAYSKLVDEDGDPDWDYDTWRPEILKAMTDGVRYDENDPSKVVKLPPNSILAIIESARQGSSESDGDFRDAANKYVANMRPDELAKQAADIEAKSLALTNAAVSKKNRNNPQYQANQRTKNARSAIVPEFTNAQLAEQKAAKKEAQRLKELEAGKHIDDRNLQRLYDLKGSLDETQAKWDNRKVDRLEEAIPDIEEKYKTELARYRKQKKAGMTESAKQTRKSLVAKLKAEGYKLDDNF